MSDGGVTEDDLVQDSVDLHGGRNQRVVRFPLASTDQIFFSDYDRALREDWDGAISGHFTDFRPVRSVIDLAKNGRGAMILRVGEPLMSYNSGVASAQLWLLGLEDRTAVTFRRPSRRLIDRQVFVKRVTRVLCLGEPDPVSTMRGRIDNVVRAVEEMRPALDHLARRVSELDAEVESLLIG